METSVSLYDFSMELCDTKRIFLSEYFCFSEKLFIFAPTIKYSFFTDRVFGFIKKGGEIRLGETLATHQQIVIKVPIPNPGKKTGDDKI
jgi:hypothetical protein